MTTPNIRCGACGLPPDSILMLSNINNNPLKSRTIALCEAHSQNFCTMIDNLRQFHNGFTNLKSETKINEIP
jgi:hypothetical protein